MEHITVFCGHNFFEFLMLNVVVHSVRQLLVFEGLIEPHTGT